MNADAVTAATDVGVVVLNWERATITLDCIQSLLAMDRGASTYLVDNGSADGSREVIYRWLNDRLGKPIARTADPSTWRWITPNGAPITFIALGANLGYAGGNNIGIRLAIRDGADAVWVLNNDTLVADDALQKMIATARERPDAGIVGACLLEWRSSTIQALGGARYVWPLTRHHAVGRGWHLSRVGALSGSPVDYIAGASMFIPTSTVQEIGLLSEDYFLYGEDLDYSERCRASGRALVVAPGARVWHRSSASLGSGTSLTSRSTVAAYYGSRSAVILIRRFRPHLLPVVVPVRILLALLFVARARPRLAGATLRGVAAGLAARLRDPPTVKGWPHSAVAP
jgi:hypothetical protein